MLGARKIASSSSDGNDGVVEPPPELPSVDSCGVAMTPVFERALGCLIKSKVAPNELPSLIMTTFAHKDASDKIRSLDKDDAQAFIDAIDEALDRPDLPPAAREICLRQLYRACGSHALLPKALKVPVCYDRINGYAKYHGGYADVWKGEYGGQEVAVKVMRIYSNSDLKEVVGRFCKEVITWRTLRHPNVLPLIGVTMSEAQFAMVSEWMSNGNINEFVKANPGENRLKLLEDVARGLIYIHQQGMIHGDLKGANILIDQTGHARLADFGLLTIVSNPANLLSSSLRAETGTVRWMSPELISPREFGLDASRPTSFSDCYALGMVIYETISGNLPFHEDMGPMVIVKVLTGERPCRLVGFTDGLWEILERCWASRASERPRVEDVLECLRMCADSSVPPSSEMDAGTGGLGFYDPIPVRQGDFNSFEHDVLPAPLLSPPPFLASDTFISPNGENLHTTPPGVASGPQLHTFPEMPITGEVLLVVPLPTTQKRLRLFQGSRARAAVTPLTQEAKTLLNYAETSSEASEKWSFLLPTSTPPISNHIYLANITVHDPSPARTSYSLTLPSSVPPAPTSRKRRRSGSDLETPSGSGSQWTSDAPMRPAGLEANIVRDLVGLFFAHCHHGRMVIHKPTFMAALSQNRVASHLILAMCAMSAPFSQSPQVKSQPPRLAGIKFYEDALNTLFDSSGRLIYEANLQTVQTLCLLEMHDVVAQYSWTKCYRYLDLAAKILFEELDIASPESPPLSPKPTIEEMSRMTERECARRCYWIIYFLHVISTACTRNVRRFSTEGMLMRLPVDESSFELGIQSQTPEYLDEMAPKANYVSEFGHLIRITALFSQMEDAVSIVDDDDRFVSAMHEATTALKAWESSLPDHLRYTKDNLHIMSSMYETPMNTGPWCFFYMHALHSCCEMSAASETQKLFRRGEFSIPKEASDAGDRCLRILESVGSRAKNLNYLIAPSLWVVSRYFKENTTMLAIDSDFEAVWGWKPCEISEKWRKHNEARKFEAGHTRKITSGPAPENTSGGNFSFREPPPSPKTSSSSSAIIRADDKDDFHQPSSITSRYPGDSEWRTLPSLRSVGLLDSFDNRRTNSNPGSALPPLSKAREW